LRNGDPDEEGEPRADHITEARAALEANEYDSLAEAASRVPLPYEEEKE